MSHFAMLVITAQKPTNQILEEALQPFHEFECTGVDDKYIQDLDITEDCLKEYKEDTVTKMKSPAGELFSTYEDCFYRDPTEEEQKKMGPPGLRGNGCGHGIRWSSKDWGDGKGYRTKVHFIPDGYEEVEVSRQDTHSFAEYLKEWHGMEALPETDSLMHELPDEYKYGYFTVNSDDEVVRVIKRTNPNRKWDWWTVGGRWSGFFTAKPAADCLPLGHPDAPSKGSPGLMGSEANAAGVDIIRKGDVDFESMRTIARRDAATKWEQIREIVGDLSEFITWEKMREDVHPGDIEAARTAYHDQPAKKALAEAAASTDGLFWVNLDEFIVDQETYMEIQAMTSTVLFGSLKDGHWVERGQMGWWACVANEKDQHTWNTEFNKMLDELPDDVWLSVVDCHI